MDSIFFGQEVLNRVSFLRTDNEYIKSTVLFESSRFVFFTKQANNIIPLVNISDDLFEPYVKAHRDLPPHFQKLLVQWSQYNTERASDLINLGFTVVFLGIDEKNALSDESKTFSFKSYSGTPYYAVYLNDEIRTSMAFTTAEPLSNILDYLKLSNLNATLISHGKMYLDWIHKYNFCPGCGTKMIPVDAGTRLFCTSAEDKNCPIKLTTVNNVCFPRTDSVVITCVTNVAGDKILLGLNNRYKRHGKMYTCVAGFMEPAETIEAATLREIWEETGCTATKLEIVGSQPWPFPVNLMIGCIAKVEFNGKDEIINLNHDKELADARWFDIEEVDKLIKGEPRDDDIILPMKESIAFDLIQKVVNDRLYKSI